MKNIVDRQTFVISVNLGRFTPKAGAVPEVLSIANLPMNLRFAADTLVVKSIGYSGATGAADVEDMVQVWCNITNDNIIATFPNTNNIQTQHNSYFSISNKFQTGLFVLQFQETNGTLDNVPTNGPIASYLPQRLISSQDPQKTKGVVCLTIEFLKHEK